MGRLTKRRLEDFSADSVSVAAERSRIDSGLHIAAGHGSPTRNREVPIKKRSRAGTSSIPFPQRHRIKTKFISGENISQIAREEKRHWTTVARIVKEQDVQEYVADLRARFYGALEDVLIAVIQYVKNGNAAAGLQNAGGRRRDSSEGWEAPSRHGTAKASGPAARQRTASDKDDCNGNGKARNGAPAILR
jgi:hypothetical protein